jgi:uncharacterized protein (DUF983 family)
MNHKKNLKIMGILAIGISILGLILDTDVKNVSSLYNIFEVLVMSAVIFGLLSIVYIGTVVVAEMLRDGKRINNGSL